MTETLLTKLQREAREKFLQYKRDGYNGGESGLRCTNCDCKYRGDAQMIQLCPTCQVDTLITNTLKQVSEEVEKMKKAIPECKCGSYENCCPHFEREDALTDVQRLLSVDLSE